MLKRQLLSIFLFSFLFSVSAFAQNGIITTIAGNGTAGFSGDGGAAINAELSAPFDVVVDDNGNVYVADRANNRVRKIDLNGIISTFAGNGTEGSGGDGGAAINAELNEPWSIARDNAGNIYIAEYKGHRVRKVDANGIITTFAGTGNNVSSGDGVAASSAGVKNPTAVACDSEGNVYIAGDYAVRVVDAQTNIITTFSGYMGISNSTLNDNIPRLDARFNIISGLDIDKWDRVYITQMYPSLINVVDTTGIIYRHAGVGFTGILGDGGPASQAWFYNSFGLAADTLGNTYIADGLNYRLRKVDVAGMISTYAGIGQQGFSGDGGAAINAKLSARQVAIDKHGRFFIADYINQRIRMIDTAQAPVSVQAIAANAEEILVYPNPARSGVVEINMPANKKEHAVLIVVNVAGQEIKRIPVETGGYQKMELNVVAGTYFLVIKGKEQNWLGKVTITE